MFWHGKAQGPGSRWHCWQYVYLCILFNFCCERDTHTFSPQTVYSNLIGYLLLNLLFSHTKKTWSKQQQAFSSVQCGLSQGENALKF